MPELAAAYVAGLLTNWILAAVLILREWRIEGSPRMRQVQRNLAPLGLRFSNSRDGVVALDGERPPSQIRTLMFLGLFCSMASWLGLVFQIIIAFSLEKLAHRERHALFGGDLAAKDLGDVSQIRALLSQSSESFRELDKTASLG
ncbi:MAG: hypothetical protein KF767_07580 [Bdellovibrionaceae bacterium]|nr:hypothetical protein [Pseudobdellovibrionaceae bacterium]